MRKIKIARIFDRYDGPSTYYLYDRMKLLPSERYETICIYLQRCSDEPNNQEKDFKCHYLSSSKSNPLKWWRLAQLLKHEKVDIIHANRHSATFQGTMGAILAGTPVVISHVHGMNRCRNLKRKFLYRVLSFKITRMIGCADSVRDDIFNKYPGINNKAIALANSINYEKYHNAPDERKAVRRELDIPPESFVFMLAARLAPKKGYDLLLEAFSKVYAKHNKAFLLLVGSGEMEGEIKEYVRKFGLGENVCLAGQRSDVPRILKACDAFTLSSTREGMPLCVFEAMAAGLPVIATGAGGTAELLENGNLGYYVEPRTPENFAQAMIDVLELSPSERQRLVEKADRKVSSVYNHEAAVKELMKIYESALVEKGVPL